MLDDNVMSTNNLDASVQEDGYSLCTILETRKGLGAKGYIRNPVDLLDYPVLTPLGRGYFDRKEAEIKVSSCETNNSSCGSDRNLFNDICGVFSETVRVYLSDVDLGAPHPKNTFEPLAKLLFSSKDPNKEFLDIEIEKLRSMTQYRNCRHFEYQVQ